MIKKGIIAAREPAIFECDIGSYSWCSCGHSFKQPFCDGSHRNKSVLKSIKFEVNKKKIIALCQCKQTENPPYCDGTHLEL